MGGAEKQVAEQTFLPNLPGLIRNYCSRDALSTPQRLSVFRRMALPKGYARATVTEFHQNRRNDVVAINGGNGVRWYGRLMLLFKFGDLELAYVEYFTTCKPHPAIPSSIVRLRRQNPAVIEVDTILERVVTAPDYSNADCVFIVPM